MSMVNKMCKIDNCNRSVWARGYCDPHYKRYRRSGFKVIPNKPIAKNNIHGMSYHPLYKLWVTMRQRCLNPNAQSYKDYGGRGITICKRWDNFANFVTDMGDKPTENHQLDRINNDGDYDPSNCRWATPSEQAQNRRMNPRNKSGHTGVTLEQNKYWRVNFERDGNRIRKNFTNKEEAIKYRQKLERDFNEKLWANQEEEYGL